MFKIGDKVKCIERYFGNETVGKIYTVRYYNPKDNLDLGVEKDDNGNQNAYHSNQFVKVKNESITSIDLLDSLKNNEENYYG